MKILRVLFALIVTTCSADRVNNRASTYFPKGSGVILNMGETEFEQTMQTDDSLMFLYLFDSKQEKSKQMNEQIMTPLLNELKGYFKFLAFDCQEEGNKNSTRFKDICSKDEHMPFFQIMKPSDVKINPYTNKPMQPVNVPYSDNQVSHAKIKNYVLNNLPDYSIKIDSLKKLEDFKDISNDSDINKVILFSKKSKTPPIFKVLTNLFRERFRFGFVSSESQDVISEFNVTKYPTIITLKSYDPSLNMSLDS